MVSARLDVRRRRRGFSAFDKLHALVLVQAAGGDMAEAALNAGLVDKLADRQALERRLAELGGEDDRAIGGYQKIKLGA